MLCRYDGLDCLLLLITMSIYSISGARLAIQHRSIVRQMLGQELAEIDELVKNILG
jgi:hypothetical protein